MGDLLTSVVGYHSATWWQQEAKPMVTHVDHLNSNSGKDYVWTLETSNGESSERKIFILFSLLVIQARDQIIYHEMRSCNLCISELRGMRR